MSIYKKITLLVVGAFLILMIGRAACQQRSPELPRSVKAELQYFLDLDCLVSERRTALAELKKFRDLVEPILIRLLKDGPDNQALQEVQRALTAEWARTEAFLKANPKLGLQSEELKIVTTVTKEDYVTRGRNQFIRQYRRRAAVGLAAIGSPQGLKALCEINEKGDEYLRAIIPGALKRYQPDQACPPMKPGVQKS